jgi:hypothetical protein
VAVTEERTSLVKGDTSADDAAQFTVNPISPWGMLEAAGATGDDRVVFLVVAPRGLPERRALGGGRAIRNPAIGLPFARVTSVDDLSSLCRCSGRG